MRCTFGFLLLSTALGCAAPPAAPSNVVLTTPFVSKLRVDWQDNSNNEAGFESAYRVGTTGAFSSIGTVSADTIFLDLNGAAPQTTYQFQVRSFLGPVATREFSAYAGPSTATTPGFINPPALLAPILSATAPGAQTLTVGTVPPPLSLSGLFTDPDVSSAARLITDLGNLDFVFYPNSAPKTAANFLTYLNSGAFTNTIFHRSVPGFIIQGGAFRADATASPAPTIAAVSNEPSITNVRGTIAMARTSIVDSATNQFFINLANNAANLDNQNGGFTVFARVAGSGMTIADAIAALSIRSYSTINGALTDTPVRGNPPAYDPNALVRISNVSVIANPLTLSASSSNPGIVSVVLTGTNLTFSPIASGTATITLTATDLDNQSVTTTFPITVRDGYDVWASQQSFAQPADAAATADPDSDGVLNVVEFALPSPPLASSPSALLPGLNGNRLTLTFPLRASLLGTNVVLQSAESLNGPWTPRWGATDGFPHPWITSNILTGSQILVTARDPDPAPPFRRFLRLKVTRP